MATREGVEMNDGERWSRGEFLTRAASATLGLTTLGGLVSGCGASTSKPKKSGGGAGNGSVGGTLALLCWQGYDDRKAAAPVLKRGVHLATTYISNNDEILTKLRGGALGSIDVVTPYFGYIKPMVEANLIQPIDYSRLPSTKTFFPEFNRNSWNTINGKVYSVPLVWADTPVVYRPDLTSAPASYGDLAKAQYKGKVTTLDDPTSNIMIFAKAALGTKTPTRITKDELKRAMQWAGGIRSNLVTVANSFGDVLDLLMRGDAALCIAGWAFLKAQAAQKGRKLATAIPKEGEFSWFDNYCIAREAPNIDAAYAFIDTMVSARGDAIVAHDTGSGAVNRAAVPRLPKQDQGLYPYNSIGSYFTKNGLYGLPPLKPEGNVATYEDWQTAWQQYKAG